MAGFLGRIFGKKEEAPASGPKALVGELLDNVIKHSGLELSYDVKDEGDNRFYIDVYGADEDLLKDKDGQLLDAFQLFVTRAVQHQDPEAQYQLEFDSNGFREEANDALIELAEKLKEIVVKKKKSVYFRALPPKDRKVVHQYLAEDERVKSHSVGDGLYKKIKIYPARGDRRPNREAQSQQ